MTSPSFPFLICQVELFALLAFCHDSVRRDAVFVTVCNLLDTLYPSLLCLVEVRRRFTKPVAWVKCFLSCTLNYEEGAVNQLSSVIASGLIPAISKAKISKKQGQHPSCSLFPSVVVSWGYLPSFADQGGYSRESLFILCGNPVLPVLVFISCGSWEFLSSHYWPLWHWEPREQNLELWGKKWSNGCFL